VMGPAIGFIILKTMGYREVFLLAVVIFLIASASSYLLSRRCCN